MNSKGSKELIADMECVKAQINKFSGYSIQQAIQEGEKLQRVDDNDAKTSVQQHNWSPESRKADWKIIRKNLNIRQNMSNDSVIINPHRVNPAVIK
jgi:hypothetical protein